MTISATMEAMKVFMKNPMADAPLPSYSRT